MSAVFSSRAARVRPCLDDQARSRRSRACLYLGQEIRGALRQAEHQMRQCGSVHGSATHPAIRSQAMQPHRRACSWSGQRVSLRTGRALGAGAAKGVMGQLVLVPRP